MALIKYAEGQQRSGSLGATVYSHNRYGQYIRARSIPTNPNTDRQSAIRTLLRNLTEYWSNSLSQAERNAWEAYAADVPWTNRVGDTVYLTGLSHFLRSNAPRLMTTGSQVDTAPAIHTLASGPGTFTATASAATQEISIAFDNTEDWANEADAFILVRQGLPQQPGIKFFGSPYRFLAAVQGDDVTPPTSPAAVPAVYPFAEGQRIWVQARISRADGRLSEPTFYNFLAAA
jgi:hypothetical protein